MRINTTNAISKALAAANKLVALQSYVLGGFVIVCGFRKVDKHVFRAYNTISGRTVFDKFHNCKSEGTIIAKDSVTGDRIYKIEDARFILKRILKTRDLWGKLISSIKGDFLPYFQSCLCLDFLSTVQNAKQQCRDILEKEGLNESEASRRVIFNCFKIQAIASYSALATLKAAQFKTYSSCKVKRFTLNSVKDLFTNLSKNYFLVREAHAITKSSPNIAAEDAAKAANTLLLPKEVRAKILIESYKLIVQALVEMCVSIVYFNLDSKLELKVLGKQDVKTTS
ncbi:hypothetical protein HBH70_182940 [Parastagonospora nodorum]|nr:hypothetical protein HBH70_182940 [Parastagonospora nodorum]